MKAIVTSIGEKTTDLCVWSLERNGFEVEIYKTDSTLWQKLKEIYNDNEESFLRIDADTVPNKTLTPDFVISSFNHDEWWIQYLTYDWFKQDITHGGAQFIRRQALPYLRDNIENFKAFERPETMLSRIKEFYEPRRFVTNNTLVGLNNYRNDLQRVRQVKTHRKQADSYDWELAQKLDDL